MDGREQCTQEVRDYAEKGMQEMAVKFAEDGAELYREI